MYRRYMSIYAKWNKKYPEIYILPVYTHFSWFLPIPTGLSVSTCFICFHMFLPIFIAPDISYLYVFWCFAVKTLDMLIASGLNLL